MIPMSFMLDCDEDRPEGTICAKERSRLVLEKLCNESLIGPSARSGGNPLIQLMVGILGRQIGHDLPEKRFDVLVVD